MGEQTQPAAGANRLESNSTPRQDGGTPGEGWPSRRQPRAGGRERQCPRGGGRSSRGRCGICGTGRLLLAAGTRRWSSLSPCARELPRSPSVPCQGSPYHLCRVSVSHTEGPCGPCQGTSASQCQGSPRPILRVPNSHASGSPRPMPRASRPMPGVSPSPGGDPAVPCGTHLMMGPSCRRCMSRTRGRSRLRSR